MLQRVVVTGVGCLTPLGHSVDETWSGLLAGRSGIKPLSLPRSASSVASSSVAAPDMLSVQIAGQVQGFDASHWMDVKEIRHSDPFIHLGVAASHEALRSAGLLVDQSRDSYKNFVIQHISDFSRVGVFIGSGIGGLTFIESQMDILRERGPQKISPFFIPGSISNMGAGYVSMRYGFRGPSFGVTSACATGSHNIGLAYRSIAMGETDVMLAGGLEMASCFLGMAGFCSLRALSSGNANPEKASRPWDKDRDGFVLSDGAGVLVLESLDHATRRKAPILAEIIGFGMSSDACHLTAPAAQGEGAALAMMNALSSAKLKPQDVGYINAHGTSTILGDLAETRAIKSVFGKHAYHIPISSTKSMTGHMLGAAGAVEAIFSVLSLKNQVIPPTINLDHPDLECDLDYVPSYSRNHAFETALSNSFGFGGTNASLAFRRWP